MVARESGVPYGRTRCTACGALGVNRATCTGDRATHAALAGPYRPQVDTGNGTSGGGFEREYEEAPAADREVEEVVESITPPPALSPSVRPATLDEIFTGEVVYTPPQVADAPLTGHNLVKTTMTFITTTPIALENCARLAIQEADLEHIWLDTEFEDVTV